MNNKLISAVVIIVLIAGGFLLFKGRSVAPTVMPVESDETSQMPVPETPATQETSVVKEFNVDATTYSFSPKTMIVNKGDTVKITVKNLNGMHDLKIDEFNVATRKLQTGETETITFVADKTGTFEYYCSVGNHRAMGMVGTLTVN